MWLLPMFSNTEFSISTKYLAPDAYVNEVYINDSSEIVL